ncbi:hypothetical protein LINPERPRIM_LOCUS1061 [Linum perenne]
MVIKGDRGQVEKYILLSWGKRWSSRDAEARALLEALSWTEQGSLREVTFETNAQVTTGALTSSFEDATEFGDISRGCKAILARRPDSKVCFVRRERNRVAHILAKHSISFLDSPSGLMV